eukprot:gnl/TRDRNA2_/TRDRNA2_119267_c2_seq1.p1 gnl/TRDRNA2_/TRDRNA2_119267_c2~~gnl/TRDRNA2_/TRDRNA2_119267_c2_seq1.p1  ORF type:complete len:537 (-),score=62.09 gnl/TRDRNA2_/TRDRNA2_119267_c2_seq1:299-1852(-)
MSFAMAAFGARSSTRENVSAGPEPSEILPGAPTPPHLADSFGDTQKLPLLPRELQEPPHVPLAQHPSTPHALRTALPLATLGTTALFVVATVTVGVKVVVDAQASDERWLSPPIADISVDNTITQMWISRAYPLVFLVVSFTLVWPYVKLMMMLHVWLRPYSIARREKLLVFLDTFGKWSLTDNFVLMVFVTLFHVKWSGPDIEGSGVATLQVRCVTEVETGVFLAATVASLVLSHTMLAVHRISSGDCMSSTDDFATGRRALWQGLIPANKPVLQVVLALCIALLLVVALLLVFAAWLTPAVLIEFNGLVGSVLDIMAQSRQQRYSLSEIAAHLSKQDAMDLSVVLTTFTVVLPVLAIVALLFLWIAPMACRMRFVVLTACQTLVAWSSLDVMAVAILGAVLGGKSYGIGNFLDTIIYTQNIGPMCIGVRENFGFDCFDMRLEFLDGAFVLFGAAATHLIVTQGTLRMMCVSHRNLRAAELGFTRPTVGPKDGMSCVQGRDNQIFAVRQSDLAQGA